MQIEHNNNLSALVMGKFGSKMWSKPTPDQTEPYFKFRVQMFDPNQTTSSIQGSGGLYFSSNSVQTKPLILREKKLYQAFSVFPKKSTNNL